MFGRWQSPGDIIEGSVTQHALQQKDELLVLKGFFFLKNKGSLCRNTLAGGCSRRQATQRFSTETIWGRKLSASPQTISIPSPLLCLSSKFSPSLSLLSDSTNPNVTAHSKQVSPPLWVLRGYVIQMPVILFTKELQNDTGRHKDAAEALPTGVYFLSTVHRRSVLQEKKLSTRGCGGYWVRTCWKKS